MKNDISEMRVTSIVFPMAVAISLVAYGNVRAEGDDIDFVGDVLPILQTHCFSCHGEKAQEGSLRLDVRDAAMRGGDSGESILVGKGDESLLMERITSHDPDLRMPQDAKPLEPDDIARLKQWIDRGANWPDSVALPAVHWSLKPLTKPEVPNVEPKSKSPIDAFIRAKLAESELQPSDEADRRTLLRRIYFDLTGLPPTPEEFASFINDSSPTAYESVVDRLLASPLYGERWARHWIDVAHWAETHGNDQDRPRPNAWPYRDYLVESFNSDKPYTRFVEEQVAGDALYPDDPQATVALGFLASGPWDESTLMSIVDDTEDRKVGQVLDRDDMVATVMSTFCSVTVHCARCHNHKFDPITITDYYALQAVFSGVERTERPFDASRATYANRQRLLKEKQFLQTASEEWFFQPSQQARAVQIEPKFVAESDAWRVLTPASFTTEHGSVGIPQPDGSLLMAGPRPDQDTYTFVFEGDFHGITGVQLEVLADPSLPSKGPGRQDNGNLHLSEVALASSLIDGSESTPLAIARAVADFNQDQWDINKAIDGKPETAWGIYPEVSKAHSAVFVLSEAIRREGKSRITLQLKQLHGEGHVIGRPRISLTASEKPAVLPPITFNISAAINTPRGERTKDQTLQLVKHLLAWEVEREFLTLPSPMFVYAAANKATSNGVPISPPAEPRRVHVLRRGDIRQPMEEASPGTLSCIDGLPSRFAIEDLKDESQRRAALARWLSDPQNVLLWRSIVNRVWHYHFGRGIVDTPNDLGKMGGIPSHPELLDWLAVEFREHGGSLKWLHKLIVMSDAYRQSSQSDPERDRIDGDNRLLWRMNATRLDAESIRDTVLAISGKLDLAMGGPSVKQFIESPGIHVTPVVDYQNFDIDSPSQYRRSIYRFLFRTLPDPFMSAMDCPDASQWAPTRSESVTALQALAMLNNRFIVRQSEHTAARLVQLADDPAEQMRLLFQLSLGREPEADESRRWQEYAGKHGLQNACRMMFNTNEFLFVR